MTGFIWVPVLRQGVRIMEPKENNRSPERQEVPPRDDKKRVARRAANAANGDTGLASLPDVDSIFPKGATPVQQIILCESYAEKYGLYAQANAQMASNVRWHEAELITSELTKEGMTQVKLAKAIGKSQFHVSLMKRVHENHGFKDHGAHPFDWYYQKEKKGIESPTDKRGKPDDPNVDLHGRPKLEDVTVNEKGEEVPTNMGLTNAAALGALGPAVNPPTELFNPRAYTRNDLKAVATELIKRAKPDELEELAVLFRSYADKVAARMETKK